MSAEEWRPIPGTAGEYEASSLGRVRSWRPMGGAAAKGHRRTTPFLMSPHVGNRGYLLTHVRLGGAMTKRTVHSLVALAFIGPRPHGYEVCHNNGNPLDNRVDNLRYGTSADNKLDQVRHGTHEKAARAECRRGHAYDPLNTAITATGARKCRSCHREDNRRYRARVSARQLREVAA